MDRDLEPFYKALPFITFYEAVLESLLTGLLLYGAIKRNIQMLKIYVIVSLIGLAIYSVFVIIIAICSAFIHFTLTIVIHVVVYAILLGIAFYYTVCVNSYLMDLEDEKNHSVPEGAALKQI